MPDLDLEPHEYRRGGIRKRVFRLPGPITPERLQSPWFMRSATICGVWVACSLAITRGIDMPWWQGALSAFGPVLAVFVFWLWWFDY